MSALTTLHPHSVTQTSNSSPVTYKFFRSMQEAAADWDLAAPSDDLFLQSAYLSIVESYPPVGMRFGYLVFYRGNDPAGVALCQIKYFKGDENIADLGNEPQKDPCFFNGLALWFKKWIAGKAAADILICGNMLLTGEHGYYFSPEKVDALTAITLLENALDEVVELMSREGVKMPVILVKDVAPERRSQGEFLVKNGFTEFDIQPNMVLELPFNNFDAYLGAMSTKYRTRAKRAFKKLDGIEKRELSAHDIRQELPTIYRLYREIAKNAGFNMVDLNETYLLGLKERLGDNFSMYGYFHNGLLVAFYSTIRNHHELEAHFLGYEKSLNHDYQLYLNILYDIVNHGLAGKCERIVFARTALEIKSSVGATAHDLWCYLRHQNPIANRFAGTLLDYLKPVEKWLPRRPFKDGQQDDLTE
ncbi:MAG: GNAT family N-acetyltransferase [Saprospiraceae bacterium]|nr:GNAT family N-acetyltransferase [Saprospiraceae bacterium]